MFGLFKKKKKEKPAPPMADLYGEPLAEGDLVESMRYELGKCKIVFVNDMLHYESLENGKQVPWVKMVDAATERQKVKKLSS